MQDVIRTELRETTPVHLLPMVVKCVARFMRDTNTAVDLRHNKKLEKSSKRQEQPLRTIDDNIVKVIGDIQLPQHVKELLAYGPKHPVRGTFNDFHFLANVDRLLSVNNPNKDTDNDIQALATWYIEQNRKIPHDSAAEIVTKYLRKSGLLAVPFDKGVGFCLMRTTDYQTKLNDILNGPQFRKCDIDDSDVKKHEEKMNKELISLKNKNAVSVELYERHRSTGAQPARMYGLAKALKQNIPLGLFYLFLEVAIIISTWSWAGFLKRFRGRTSRCQPEKLRKHLKELF